MKVPSKSVHKVTLMFLQHLHHSLQLSQSEALFEGASSPKGYSCPLHQICTLQGVWLQTWLPQPGPETAATSLVCTAKGQEKHIHNPKLITIPSACYAAIPLTSIARPYFPTHVYSSQESSTAGISEWLKCAVRSVHQLSKSLISREYSENPINSSQSGDAHKLTKLESNHLKPSHSKKKKKKS